jgi:hypothetical protein
MVRRPDVILAPSCRAESLSVSQMVGTKPVAAPYPAIACARSLYCVHKKPHLLQYRQCEKSSGPRFTPSAEGTSPHGRDDRPAVVLWSLAGAAMLAAVIWAVGLSHNSAQEAAGDPLKWRPVWDSLMPLFTHPRCANCHGGTNPFIGEEGLNHEGGRAEQRQCTNCTRPGATTARRGTRSRQPTGRSLGRTRRQSAAR